ncbi:diguanylate cyclase domain-containing protein [Planctomicrobium sp. SH668]|uniref:diguanylate cyclase domain-containing protein n=1 Tax=Planctomicrobium sp. SH668 TaxID=3448126 RepID=UPI003F5BA88A
MNSIPLPTILVVDDERLNRTTLAELLQDDYRVILAKDGPTALDRISSDKIDLVLLDAQMPEMDGYEVLRQIKSDEKTANISVIFVTGQTNEEDEERGLLMGASDYIGKPIRPLLVKARVRNHLKMVRQREALEQLSLQDGLTGIANRRGFDQAFSRACRQTVRTSEPLGLALIDVDHFKKYNDHYGHGAGDETLRRVAQTLNASARRPYDLVARYGGEEFVVLFMEAHNFRQLLETVRKRIEDLKIPHAASSTGPYVTVSIGGIVASVESAKDPAKLLEQSDIALYQAKRNGRNRVVLHGQN